jgi:hypothetical protein
MPGFLIYRTYISRLDPAGNVSHVATQLCIAHANHTGCNAYRLAISPSHSYISRSLGRFMRSNALASPNQHRSTRVVISQGAHVM